MDRAPSSASLCPGCGKPIDPLRAGQVAILDGVFRYFCDATCKAAYVQASSKAYALSANTAEPPPVQSVEPSGVRADPAKASGVRAQPAFPAPPMKEPEPEAREPEAEEPAPEAEEPEPEAREPEASEPPASDEPSPEPAREAKDEREEKEAPPATLRSPSVVAARPNAGAPGGALTPGIGIAAGILAAVVGLAGEGGSTLRVPFAVIAASVVALQTALRPRDPGQPHPWIVAAPVLVAAAVSVTTRADAHGAFAGLAAAGLLVVDLLVTRARRDVVEARAKVASALDGRAKVVRGEATTEVDAAHVKPGEQVVVEAGETVLVDGMVASGSAEVAPWADSPVVVDKREGDAIVAGATIVSGRLRVNATFTGGERAWNRLASPGASRAPVEAAAPLAALARRTTETGAPIAALLVGGATYANNGAMPDVVVAACAGAYAAAALAAVTAVGLAHARGQVAAQRRGVVYKDADAFDRAARAEIAVMCSRGTVLLGEPEIVAIEAISGKNDAEVATVLALAAGAEMASSHPLAAAVLRAARSRNVRPENVRSALEHAGLGVTALAPNGDKVIVGSRAFLLQEKVSVALADARVSELEAEGRSVMLVALGGRIAGLLALQDGLRPGARAAVQRLHDAHVEPVLLSGEARETCETIARALSIDHVRPEILPADRGAEVRALADGGHVVAAIGHASSDDGALGAADVSVAMTAAGAAPGEWSSCLASDDVRDAALALTIPRACRDRAKIAALVGAAGQLAPALGIAFGVLPPLVAPVTALVAAAVALSVVREREVTVTPLRP